MYNCKYAVTAKVSIRTDNEAGHVYYTNFYIEIVHYIPFTIPHIGK